MASSPLTAYDIDTQNVLSNVEMFALGLRPIMDHWFVCERLIDFRQGSGTVVWSRRGKIRLRCPVVGARLAATDGRALPPHMALVPEGGAAGGGAGGAAGARAAVSWWRDGERLAEHSESLVVQAKRGGAYRCGVRSAAGLVLGTEQIIKLATLEKQFAEEPSDTTAEEGQPVMLRCRIQSSPPANISWSRDTGPLPLDDRYNVLRTGELLITEVTEADSGNYSCSASNWHLNRTRASRGAALDVVRVRVRGAPPPLEPAFLRASDESREARPRVGEQLLLSCAATGRPRPQVVWEIARSGEPPAPVGHAQVLRIRSVQPEDSGVYSCRLPEYPQMTKTFEVSVLQPARIVLAPEPIHKPSAGTVRFNCSATGRPPPTVLWYKNGQPLSLTGRVKLREKSGAHQEDRKELVISGVQPSDAGVYQCFAQSAGTPAASAWAALGVAGGRLPGPAGVRCRPAGLRAVRLDWLPVAVPRAAPAASAGDASGVVSGLYYTVSSTPEAGGQESIKVDSEDPSTPSMDVGVKPLALYAVTVRAYFGKDASKPSEPVLCQGQGVPVNVASSSNDSVSVSWSEEANGLTAVSKWMLQYRRAGEPTQYNVTLEGAARSYVLPGVASDERYEVRLLATTSEEFLQQDFSELAWTPTHSAQPVLGGGCEQSERAVVPNALAASKVGARTLRVSWRCDACENSSCYYSFVLCYKRFDALKKLHGNREECKHSDTSELDVGGLDPGQQYQFKVQALVQGRAKGGEFSDVLLAATLVDESRRIKKVSHKYIGDDGLYVWWTVVEPSNATSNTNSTVYTVHYSQNLTRPLEEWIQKIVTGQTNVELYGLEPDLKTYVMVSCRSKWQEEHGPVMEVPPRVESRRVKSVHYAYGSEGALRVWWSVGSVEGARNESEAAEYSVHYSQNPSRPLGEWRREAVAGRTDAALYGLEPDLKTYVMVSCRSKWQEEHGPVMEVPPRTQPSKLSNYTLLGIIAGAVVCATCLLCCAVLCVWRKRRSRGARARTKRTGANGGEEGVELTVSSGARVNGERGHGAGGRGRGAGEPLLNGHVRITENPALPKTTPNGKYRIQRQSYDGAFDLSRHEEPDLTLDTILEADTSTESHSPHAKSFLSQFDTSRTRNDSFGSRSLSRDESKPSPRDQQRSSPKDRRVLRTPPKDQILGNLYSKFPDDNMNSETVVKDSGISIEAAPTLEPNG